MFKRPLVVIGFVSAVCVLWSLPLSLARAQDFTVIVSPSAPIQGESVLITVTGAHDLSNVASMTLGSSTLKPFLYNGNVSALHGFDFRAMAGEYPLTIRLSDGITLTQSITLGSRIAKTEHIDIPVKLGGNSVASQKQLVSNLGTENWWLSNLWTGKKAFWTKPFMRPLKDSVITDGYGYMRSTGQTLVAHKGTDYRAELGTPVYAMNRGVVRGVRNLAVYGKTVVVDHGLGLQTLYLHLSQVLVNPGELVLPGQTIGRAGDTGYAEYPHLHLSVKISGVSVDPEAFLSLFSVQGSQTIN